MKIRRRSLLLLLSLSLVTTLLLCLGARSLLRTSIRQQLTQRIHAELDLLASTLSSHWPEDVQSFAVEARRLLEFRVTLIDDAGTVMADSSMDRDGVRAMDNHLGRPEVQACLSGGVGESLRLSASTGVEYYYVARRLDADSRTVFVRLALPSARLQRIEGGPLWTLWGAVLAVLLLHTAAAYAGLSKLSLPVEQIARSLNDAAAEELPAEIPYEANNEIGALGAALNRLRHHMDTRLRELGEGQRLLAAAVSGMQEGLLVVGPDHHVLLANNAFRANFRLQDDPAGQLLTRVLRDPAVLRDLDTALGQGREVHDTTFHSAELDRTFELHVTPLDLAGPGESQGSRCALLLFFDITRLEALETVRRDFVANVSHELRTPLTSIKAFVETLLEEGLEDREHGLEFLRIVRKHAGRMEELVDDLTDLSLIETASVSLEKVEMDLSAAAGEALEQVGHRYQGSAVTLHNDIPSPFLVHADRRRMEQILLNLVDNAVKFNKPDGSVRISASRTKGKILVAVEDTGSGIPSDSLEKIFHRFYRVDKARSRDVGGTGLGLAIVKHLMRLHDGRVLAESELGRGARFTLEFPEKA